jgi:thymidylate kinase
MHAGVRAPGHGAPVVEFLGLPGAGKSTVALALVAALQAEGIAVRTTDDFVAWLASQSRLRKLAILVHNGAWAGRQLWTALRFGLSLRPVAGFSLSRIVLVPFINCCFEAYRAQERGAVLVMDQANMQLVWSVGAYADSHDVHLLHALFRIVRGRPPTLFAYISASPEISAERIRQRPSTLSRFDRETPSGLTAALNGAARLMDDLADCLRRDGGTLLELDATASVERSAERLFVVICDAMGKRSTPASCNGRC